MADLQDSFCFCFFLPTYYWPYVQTGQTLCTKKKNKGRLESRLQKLELNAQHEILKNSIRLKNSAGEVKFFEFQWGGRKYPLPKTTAGEGDRNGNSQISMYDFWLPWPQKTQHASEYVSFLHVVNGNHSFCNENHWFSNKTQWKPL